MDKTQEINIAKYELPEIDHSISMPSQDMLDNRREPLIGVALEILRKNGSISVLDAGCGTGFALFELKDELLHRTGNKHNPSIVQATGISLEDYSQKSENRFAREAIKNQYSNYIVDDLSSVNLIQESIDLCWSHEVLIHNSNEKIVKIINNILPAIKPNGYFYFNLNPDQRNSPEVSSVIQDLKEKDNYVYEYSKEDRYYNEKRIFVMIKKKI